MSNLGTLPELVVQRIGEFLAVVDYCRLRQTCRHLHASLSKLRRFVIKGRHFDFHMSQDTRDTGHYCPKRWFDSPPLPGRVKSITVSMEWKDQGYGNRKGQVWVQLMRGDEMIAEKTNIFGFAPHDWQNAEATINGHNLINLSKKGDFYRFMRNAGGGGGHILQVENFQATLICHSLGLDDEAPSNEHQYESGINWQLDELSRVGAVQTPPPSRRPWLYHENGCFVEPEGVEPLEGPPPPDSLPRQPHFSYFF
eukprot:Seg846.1 transcript_id=Seg846.1/GoldUCD/mRNA.D3Y31 product="hypothetical protein" protein_id=Seg846.1/GoldUCD/D3Y31